MRKVASVFLAVFLLIGLCCSSGVLMASAEEATAFSGGTGTAADPYKISTADDLKALSAYTNNREDLDTAKHYMSSHYIMTATISLNADDAKFADWADPEKAPAYTWNPIGVDPFIAFTGTFDGQGFYIKGLYTGSNGNAGMRSLFGMVGNSDGEGIVKNLNIKNSYIYGKNNIGSIAGMLYGTIENCSFEGIIDPTNATVGGIVGNVWPTGKIIGCVNKGSVKGANNVGGIAGLLGGGTIETSYNLGTVEAFNANSAAGGIAGTVGGNQKGGTITDCYNLGEVKGVGIIGGLVGNFGAVSGSTMTDSFTAGKVTALEGATKVGAAAGQVKEGSIIAPIELKNCYFDSTIAGELPAIGNDEGEQTANVKGLATADMTGKGAAERMKLDAATWLSTDSYPSFGSLNFARGTGTAADPYQISNADQLKCLMNITNDANSAGLYLSSHYVLTADISLNADDAKFADWADPEKAPAFTWNPIGVNVNKPFIGTFDGKGHSISGLYTGSNKNAGGRSFIYTVGNSDGEGVVKNLNVKNAYIYGKNNIGSIAGMLYGTIENCSFEGIIDATNATVGGIAGNVWPTGKIIGCVNKGSVKGANNVGGVAGLLSGSVTTSYNLGTVEAFNANSAAGGIAGTVGGNNNGGTIANCYNLGEVKGVGIIGGLVGNFGAVSGSTMTDSFTAGKVTALEGATKVGAVAGQVKEGTIIAPIELKNCYFDSTVAGELPAIGNDEGEQAANVKGLATADMTGKDAVEKMKLDKEIWSASESYPVLGKTVEPDPDPSDPTDPTEPTDPTDPDDKPTPDTGAGFEGTMAITLSALAAAAIVLVLYTKKRKTTVEK